MPPGSPAPVAAAAALAEALPSLDPALEQRIRSIFRDTALSGEPPSTERTGKDES
jgi:hypothetical protein